MQQPLVTIAIPFYNNERTILDAIRSVFAQTYSNWELLLLNDGSTDKGLELVSAIKSPKIRVFSDKLNKGLVTRLNQIPALARGEYLARMDGDDMMHPLRIEKQVQVLQGNQEIDLVDTGAYTIDEEGCPIGCRGLQAIHHDAKRALKSTLLRHPSIMGRKCWFLQNKYDEKYVRAEDKELFYRTFRHSTFYRIREPLHIYRLKINLRDDLRTRKTSRLLLRNHGPDLFSRAELGLEILKNYYNASTFTFFYFFWRRYLWMRKKRSGMPDSQKQELERLLKTITDVELPQSEYHDSLSLQPQFQNKLLTISPIVIPSASAL